MPFLFFDLSELRLMGKNKLLKFSGEIVSTEKGMVGLTVNVRLGFNVPSNWALRK
jgi:hypothetical protein